MFIRITSMNDQGIGYQIGDCSIIIAKAVAIREVILSTIQMEHTMIVIESGSQVTNSN